MSKLIVIIILTPAMLLQAHTEVTAGEVLQLKDTVVVQKARVYLSDMVSGKLDGIENYYIVSSPRWGGDKIVTLNYINNRLRHEDISVKGPARIIVDRRALDRSEEIKTILIQRLTLKLEELIGENGIDSTGIDLRNFPSTLEVPPGDILVKCNLPPRLNGLRSVSFIVSNDKGFSRRFTAQCKFRLFGSYAVAARDLDKHSIIEEEDIRWARGDMGSCYVPPATPATLEYGVRVDRLVKAGKPVPRSALERKPDVRRGEVVRVKITRGALCVTAEGRSLEDGWMGDRILVRNRVSGRIEKYFVVGPSEVAPN